MRNTDFTKESRQFLATALAEHFTEENKPSFYPQGCRGWDMIMMAREKLESSDSLTFHPEELEAIRDFGLEYCGSLLETGDERKAQLCLGFVNELLKDGGFEEYASLDEFSHDQSCVWGEKNIDYDDVEEIEGQPKWGLTSDLFIPVQPQA